MKKIIFLLNILLLSAFGAHAQECSSTDAPYYLDFETDIPIPECTKAETAASGTFWRIIDNPGPAYSGKVLAYTGNETAADAWFFTQGISVTAGVKYIVKFKYGNDSTATTEKIQPSYGLERDATSAVIFGAVLTPSDGNIHTARYSYLTFPTTGVYYLGFHALSDANQGKIYIDDISIELSTCGVPGNFTADNISKTGADLNWTSTTGGNVTPQIMYQYAFSTTNTPPAEGTINFTGSQSLTNLLPGTTYYAFVRQACSTLWSDWATTQFTTPCATATVPYTLDFETASMPGIPQCTSVANVTTGNQWKTTAAPGNGFTSNTLTYMGTDTAADAWFFTQGITLEAGTKYHVKYKYGNNSTTTIEKLQVTVGAAPDAASATKNIADHTIKTGQMAISDINYFTVDADGVYYFGFNVNSEAAQGSLYVDDFSIDVQSCGVPANVAVSAVTRTTATITWEAPTTGNSAPNVYQYAYSTTDTPLAEGTYNPSFTANLANLTPGTTYYVFTRTLCGTMWSDWTASVSFTTTPCEVAAVPYTQDFELATVPAVPTCNTIVPVTEGNTWVTVNDPGNGSTGNVLSYTSGDKTGDAWFFTQGIALTGGKRYKVSYKYGNNGATTEKLKVTVGTTPAAGGDSFAHDDEITGGVPKTQDTPFFMVNESGTYYFGFNAYSDANEGTLYVDDFSIEEEVCGTPVNVKVSDITTTTATVTWEVPVTGNAPISVYQYAYGINDTPPADGTYNGPLTINLTDLAPGTVYYVFTRTACGPLWSDWVTTQFTTQQTAGLNNTVLKDLVVYPNPVKNNLKIAYTATIDKIELYNLTGQLVHSQAINSTNTEVNLEKLATGTYLLTVYADGITKKIRVLKQ